MVYDSYQLKNAPDFLTFEFVSVGSNGNVRKAVRYAELSKGLYNLGFGDKDPLTGDIDDLAVTNNNDTRKVLMTVAATLYLFMDRYPYATVLITGSTASRTRLYRMGISNNLQAIEEAFVIFGFAEKSWELCRKNGPYQAFLVQRKL